MALQEALWLLLVGLYRAVLFTDSRYTFQARQEVFDATVRIAKNGIVKAVGESLRKLGAEPLVAYSAAHLTVAQKEALHSASGANVRWLKDASAVERLRAGERPR